ncbi:MAG: 2-C-methyl-D-erythritol 4-phosphate cytidylyltransferase [Pseudonocardia sp.]
MHGRVAGTAADVHAVVVVGDGPYDLAPVGGVPAVVHAVRAVLAAGIVDDVTLVAVAGVGRRALRLCASLPVRLAGADAGLGHAGAGIVLLHEAIRPLAPPELVTSVVAAVRAGAPAAVPALPLTDTVKQVDGGVLHGAADRATLRVVQSPVAFRPRGWSPAGVLDLPAGALDLVARCAAAKVAVHAVPGHAAAVALRSPWDVELAGMLLAGVAG